MEYRQQQLLDDAKRSREYLDAARPLIPRTHTSSIRTALEQLISETERNGLRQIDATEAVAEAVREKMRLRDALVHQQLAPAVAAARLAFDNEAMCAGMALSNLAFGDREFIVRARAIAATLARHANDLIAVGLQPTFLDEFEKATTAVETALTAAQLAKAERATATFALKRIEKQLAAVLNLLDRMIRAELDGSSPALAAWLDIKNARGSRHHGRSAPPEQPA